MNQSPTTNRWQRLWRNGLKGGIALLLGVLLPMQSSALAAPAVAPGAVPGQGKAAATSLWPGQKQQSASAKIHKSVSDEFAKSARQVTYMVKLRAQADVMGAAALARAKATPASKEVLARTAVINSLKETAAQSQRGLLAELQALMKKGSVSKADPYWVANVVVVTSTRDVMERMAKRSDVAQILPNSQIRLVKPANTGISGQAGPVAMGNVTAQSVEWGLQRIGAPGVWNTFGIDGTGVVVANLDSGVDGAHPALASKWRGALPGADPAKSWFDVVNGRTTPYDDNSHGTHTMGTMVGSDGATQIGVAPGARWIAAKILSGDGFGTGENIIRAGEWILAPGGDPSMAPDVVNNSWGAGPGVDDWFRDVVRAWRAAGIVPIFSNGNDGPGDGTAGNPGNYPESFAVGATDINDALAGFSSRGPSAYGIMKPEISAPGVAVRSSVPGGGYENFNGTSMAAPHVAGTVALLRAANAALTVEQIEQILIASADPKTDSRYTTVPNNGYGHGILNALTAVAMVVDGVGEVSGRVLTGGDDFVAPTVAHTPIAESYKRIPIEVTANVADNVAVINVQLRFRIPGLSWWGTADMARAEGDHKSGKYVGSIPADMTFGDQVEYYIQAMDHAGNMAYSGSATRPHRVTLLDGIQPPYDQGFEAGAGGWSHGGENDVWQVGAPTSGPMAAHTGANVAATNLAGNYPDGSESYLMSPPIDLSGTTGKVAFSFWHWYQMETNFDVGFMLASGDGGNTFQVLDFFTGDSQGWKQAVIDLSDFAGNPNVYLAFYLSSDGSINFPGWYIDDLSLHIDEQAPAAPAGLQAAADAVGSINLSWNAVDAADMGGYRVYRSETAGSGYASVGTSSTTTFADATGTAGTQYHYVVTAVDMFGNESAHSNEASATPAMGNTLFQDDMESGDNGWTHSGNADSWQRGTPTSGPNAAHSGANAWATNLAGDYPVNSGASLISPPINLSGVAGASLRFAHWYAMERNFDFGHVEVSADAGATWTPLASYTSPSGGTAVGWENVTMDLGAYAGQTIQIRFRFESDGSVNFPGWYIDDVMVAGAGTNSATPPNAYKPMVRMAVGPKGKAMEPSMSKQFTLPARKAATAAPKANTAVQGTRIGINSLPLDATVTVVETGRVLRTDPATGGFRMILPAGTFTLRAEAYGYMPAEKSVTVERDATTSAILVLDAMPKGRITGLVTDGRSGQPVAGAVVSVLEDMRVAPVLTGADGRYMMEVLQGTYTLQVGAAGYYPTSDLVRVAGGATEQMDMFLEPFIGMPGEIAYDDGTAENAWALNVGGNGVAARMSPPAGQTVQLQGARFFLWDESWPVPGGNTFRVAVFEANPDGSPGRMVGNPVSVTNAVRGGWTDVDLSSLGAMMSGDFFIAYIQDRDYPNTPGFAVDESTPDTGRNLMYVGGSWSPWEGGGNLMIRAKISTEVGVPTITSPEDGSFTNVPALLVSGTSTPSTTVEVMLDGAPAGSGTADAAGRWSVSVQLTEGAHELMAIATTPTGGSTLPSAPVAITLDSAAPVLSVEAPAPGASQNSRIILVNGRVNEPNLRSLKVNGLDVMPAADGAFSKEIVGNEGANTITVEAIDHAANVTTISRTVMIDSIPPALSAMQPASNMTLYTGDSVLVSFDSEPGLALAAFQIGMTGATANAVKATALEPGEVAMTEVRPGHYEARWTLPDGMSSDAAFVRMRAVDAAGNVTRISAPGTLRLIDNNRPVAVVRGPASARVNTLLTYDGRDSTDSDGQIVAWDWNWGDGTTGTGSRAAHRWARPGTYTVTLTVTDDKGATATATARVTILR